MAARHATHDGQSVPPNMMSFDELVAALRLCGVPPKCLRKPKSKATAYEWACHREYMAARYRDPRCRIMHDKNQLKYLSKK